MCTVAAFAGLSACTAMKRAVETEAQQEVRRQRDLADTSTFYKSLTERILMRLGDGKHEEIFDVLVLSGGGDFGAFGAGFLLGWGQVEDPSMRRPKFDFVAGTSTGALRLEDKRAGAVWLQLANKSMLMDQKKGRRVADECAHPAQVAYGQDMKTNPPPSLFDKTGMGRSND
jgi:hypothetical protein